MRAFQTLLWTQLLFNLSHGKSGARDDPGDLQEPLKTHKNANYQAVCPDYSTYSKYAMHPPFSEGPLALPFQRPSPICRTFKSELVDKVVEDIKGLMQDKDLARIFENAFPNTVDTTVRWHVNGTDSPKSGKNHWNGPQSFIVTGDITAEWLRDSTNQLAQYQSLAKKDKAIYNLILGAINTQAEFIITSPYCNAFQPPSPSGLEPSDNQQNDRVHPAFDPNFVFECKYELDSLAAFLSLSTQFYSSTRSKEFLTRRWFLALDTIMAVLHEQSKGTFDEVSGQYQDNEYRFQRYTDSATETLGLSGIGNPLNTSTGLIRSAFRPSDDATIFGFLIPANAMMSVQLGRASKMLHEQGHGDHAKRLKLWGDNIEKGIYDHGVVKHPVYGDVFAYEIDGYGSHLIMDDANLPSLLSLPLLGFVKSTDRVYQSTRMMVLDRRSNPYYLTGQSFRGTGGPHVGLHHAWPMSLLVQAMTSHDDEEIMANLNLVKTASPLGLMHESINVNSVRDYTRSWFAWANSVFAQTILDVAKRKPHLLFGKGARPYSVGHNEHRLFLNETRKSPTSSGSSLSPAERSNIGTG